LNLECDELLSSFAFNFILSRYTEGKTSEAISALLDLTPATAVLLKEVPGAGEVGRCRLTL
jgi:cation transport ATPase